MVDDVVIAVIPVDHTLDDEAEAAARAGLCVCRFAFLDHVEPRGGDWQPIDTAGFRRGVHRGFMLSAERYAQLCEELATIHGIELIVSPAEYASAHYFPNAYPHIAAFAPRAWWTPFQRTAGARGPSAVDFADTAKRIVQEWGGDYLVLKDYVKSAKPHFLKVRASLDDICEAAVGLVEERGTRFNRGVVFKEYVPLRKPANEWRLWFVKGELVAVDFNSEDDYYGKGRLPPSVPRELQAQATVAAQAIGNLFVTIDFAQAEDGHWFCLEAGDGGVSGPAVRTDLRLLWKALAAAFSFGSVNAAAAARTAEEVAAE